MMIDQNLLSTIGKAQGNKYFLKKMTDFLIQAKAFNNGLFISSDSEALKIQWSSVYVHAIQLIKINF